LKPEFQIDITTWGIKNSQEERGRNYPGVRSVSSLYSLVYTPKHNLEATLLGGAVLGFKCLVNARQVLYR
jgi:hypothetical protein